MTEHDVFQALKTRFAPPEFVLLPGVRNSVGFVKKARTADAVAFSVFPSRGLYAHGLEIKLTKSDLRKELDDPTKADAIARYCSRWSVAAPKGVVPVDQLPPAWGLVEVEDGSTKVKKHPQGLEAQAPDWGFFAVLVKALREHESPVDETEKKLQQAVWAAERKARDDERERSKRALEVAQQPYRDLLKVVADYERESGLRIGNRWGHSDAVGRAVRFVLDTGMADEENRKGFMRVLTELDRLRDRLVDLVGDMPKPSRSGTEYFI